MKTILILFTLFLVGCSSTPQYQKQIKQEINIRTKSAKRILKSLPEWYMNVPVDGQYMYEKAHATSYDFQSAINKATLLAKTRLVLKLKGEVVSTESVYQDDVGDSSYTLASTQSAMSKLTDVEEVNTELYQEEGKFSVYMLIRYPLKNKGLEKAQKALAQLKEKK
jgi:PBP1b-binding outer membrane lipoprotein LpoB